MENGRVGMEEALGELLGAQDKEGLEETLGLPLGDSEIVGELDTLGFEVLAYLVGDGVGERGATIAGQNVDLALS